tara:strand:- start:1035 stop:1619 length:585 start_codon:yes stop_codon:yes gene_type:complete
MEVLYYDNVIRQIDADNLERKMINPIRKGFVDFGWFYVQNVVSEDCEISETPSLSQHMFVHGFYEKNNGVITTNENYNAIVPILEKIQPDIIVRIKANLYPNTPQVYAHGFHVDSNIHNIMTAVYFVNDNNGKFIIKDEHGKKIEIENRKNRLVVLPHGVYHTGTTCSDTKTRVVINFNYICESNHPHYEHYNI